MMKDRLHDLGIKTTELSEYMRISRPSLYKYIDLYESKEYKNIPENVLRVFRYIDRYKSLTKEQIITFVICEFADLDSSDKKGVLRNYLLRKGANDPKIDLMYMLVTTDVLDGLVEYLADAVRILDRGVADDKELQQVARLVDLRSCVMRNIPVSENELDEVKRILGE